MWLIDLLNIGHKECFIRCDYFVAYFKEDNSCILIDPDDYQFKKLLYKEVDSITLNGSAIQININEV